MVEAPEENHQQRCIPTKQAGKANMSVSDAGFPSLDSWLHIIFVNLLDVHGGKEPH
jgi:hypothetical protein